MEAQGYTIENNVLYQDNKSTILLAKNGCMSAKKASKHINNWCFLITDKIAQDKLTIHHRGTELMWANGNTKPLQGNGFRLSRSVLMGNQPDSRDEGIISKQDIVYGAQLGVPKIRNIRRVSRISRFHHLVLVTGRIGPSAGPDSQT